MDNKSKEHAISNLVEEINRLLPEPVYVQVLLKDTTMVEFFNSKDCQVIAKRQMENALVWEKKNL